MFSMENLDLDAVNRQFFFDAQTFLGGGGLVTGGGSASGASSTNSSDLFLYDDSSDSGSSYSYASDQENSTGSSKE